MKKRILFFILLFFITILLLNNCKKKETINLFITDKDNKAVNTVEAEVQNIKDYSNTTINYFNIKKIDDSIFKIKEDNTPFTIVDHGPVDYLPSNVTNPTIYVVFSQSVVPLSKLGEPITKSDIMKLEPDVNGIYRWYGTKLLSFEPKDKFMPQRKYKVTISRNIKSLGGKSLKGNNEFDFQTEYLNVHSCGPSGDDIPLDSAKKIIITFNFPVNTNVIKNFINIKNDGKNFNFKISRPKKEKWMDNDYIDKSVLLEVEGNFKENSVVTITIQKGAKSENDYIGIPNDIVKSFSTIKPFTYLNFDTYSYSFPRSEKGDSNPIYINFSHPVDQKSLNGNINITLNVPNLNDNIEVWGNTVKISNLPVDYDSTYYVTIKSGIKDIYGRSLKRDEKIEVYIPDASRYYYFPNTGIKMLEASFPPKIIYEYQNIFDGVWKIDRIDNPYNNYYESSDYGFQSKQLYPYDFSKLKKNVKHFDVLDLTKWLNQEKKGFVGITWNFGKKDIPEKIDYDTFQNKILRNVRNKELKDNLMKWFYTNNEKRYYWLNYDYAYKEDVKKKIRDIFIVYGLELTRPEYTKQSLLLQVTDLAVTARLAYNKVVVLSTYISTGKPVVGAKVQLLNIISNSVKKEGQTDGNGICIINLKENEYKDIFSIKNRALPKIRVEKGNDKMEFVPNDSHDIYHFGIYNVNRPYEIERTKSYTFIFTDRGLYKPGETITYRGIDRDLRLGNYSSYKGSYYIEARSSYSNAAPVYSSKGNTSESGGFYGTFKLPENIEPGYYNIIYKRGNYTAYSSFQVANFRRLNFEVNITAPDITYYNGDEISLTVNADYLSGGSLSGANCEYYWTKKSYFFIPQSNNFKSYTFGLDTYDYYDYYEYGPDEYDNNEVISSGSSKLNSQGKLTVKQKTTSDAKRGQAYSYNLFARVQDIDRQEIQGGKSVIVHPASFYIGTKFASKQGWWSPFVKKGETINVDYALVKPDGDLYKNFNKKNKLQVKLFKEEWKIAQQNGVYNRINSRYEKEEILEYQADVEIKDSLGKFNMSTKDCGKYILELSCMDNEDREAVTRLVFYSTGASWISWGTENVTDINLIADRNIYKPKDTVRLLVQSPLPEGKYLVTIEREGIFEEKVIDLKGSANIIEIPVKEEYTPVFYISVASYSLRTGKTPSNYFDPDLGKPKGYFGITTINVSTDNKEIVLEVNPSKTSYLPGADAEFTIKATRNGKPLRDTEITFLAVDRGVIDLINYHIPDPLKYFYNSSHFPLGVIGADSRSLLIDPVTYEVKDLYGGEGDDSKMNKRKDFNPTAVFKPFLKTDANGKVTVKFKLPDSLTTYRCTAIAVNDDYFGLKENEIKVQNPINVRTALPRKLRIRDTSFAGVVLTNLDNQTHEVKVRVESDILVIEGNNEVSVKIPSNSSLEVPFRIAAVKEGEATITFTTLSKVLKEQLEVKLIVEKPIIKEAFTTIGKTKLSVKDNNKSFAQEGLIIPSNISQGYGGLTISLDSTRLTNLAESIKYLYDYPYGCLEQRSSKIFPLVVFGEKIQPFIQIKNIKSIVENEIASWAKFQNSDGGFPYWLEGGNESEKFISIKVAKVLYFAKQNGFNISSDIYINKLLEYISNFGNYYSDYLKIYSLYVQSLYGRNVLVKAQDFLDKKDQIGTYGYAFLGLTFVNNNRKDLAEKCLIRLKNSIKVGTQTIDLEAISSGYYYYFNSQINELSLLLMLFDKLDPNSHFIEKIINTVMQRQKNGYWGNTVATEWVIQGFAQIYSKELGEDTNFNAMVDINNKNIINTNFKGVSKQTYVKNIDFEGNELNNMKRDVLFPIDFKTEGKGTMYYTATIRYALPSEVVIPRDEGFSIYTEIYDMDNNKINDDNGLKLGQTYKMKAVISSSKRRQFVAARIPIPSGAEILDSSFVTTASYEDKAKKEKSSSNNEYYWYYGGNNYIQNIMDNEVQYIFNTFFEGKEDVEFLFRVTTPGIFPTPPAYVECMYEEEVFGRTQGKLYVIKQE